ncbi:MAG TPA: hypothetical protein VFH44_00905 [Solirubrobacterales bacterium]|nr:hypothetical protein [Solirubrobacterales bacterium]
MRSRLGSIVGPSGGYAALVRREKLRQWALAGAVFVAFVACGVVGCSIGSSQAGDAQDARQAGTIAGEERGAKVGAREGYRSAFSAAREDAYDAAYQEAYTTAYRKAFERADLAEPQSVKVSAP